MRVVQLAKTLKMEGREVVNVAKELGIDVANTMSNLERHEADKIRDHVRSQREQKQKEKENIKPRVDIGKIEEKLAKEAKVKAEQEKISKAEQAEKDRIEIEKEEQRRKEQEQTRKEEEARRQKEQAEREKREEEARVALEKERKEQERKKAQTIAKKNKPKNNKRRKKRDLTKKTGVQAEKRKAQKRHAKEARERKDEDIVYKIELPITVGEFAEAVDKSSSDIIMTLMGLGVMSTINENLDEEVVELLALELGIDIEVPEPEEEKSVEEIFNLNYPDNEEDLVKRPPVVTVMGHVDHGKTSLLDSIKESDVTGGEAGGITQHIAAYNVDVGEGRTISFLDTPGHEAFTMMRMRGAQVTDIAILVVAANDGVMPQTIEAISHAKAAEVPIIVAINKIDLPEANTDMVMSELAEHDLVPEDWGGQTIMVPVSAKTGEGIEDLLEMVLLLSDVQELKGNPNRSAIASVVDAELDVGRGPVATILVENGTLHVGDYVASGVASGRVRSMTNDRNQNVEIAGPSMPVEIQGLSDVPNAGDYLYAFTDEKDARDYAEYMEQQARRERLASSSKVTLDDLFERIKEGELQDLNLIIKGDVKGSIEALSASLQKIESDEVKINIIHSAVGGITESDVTLASTSDAIILGFNVRPNTNALELARQEEVDIRTYRVIYQAIEDIEAAVKGMHAPKYVENFIGRIEVRETFNLPNNTTVAGGYVIQGKVTRDSKVTVLRDDYMIHEGEVSSLRRFTDDVSEVNQGYECGIGIENFNDIKVGDIIEASVIEEVRE